jgi:hypothetical protein
MEVPLHTLLAEAEILTNGWAPVETVTVMLFEVAVAGDTQAAFDVSTQVTASLLFNEVVVNVALLVPALNPFTFHW